MIGREARAQILEADGRLPDALRRLRRRRLQRDRACSRRSSTTSGGAVRRRGGGRGRRRPAATPRRSAPGRVGVLHGSKSYVLCDADGQIAHAHSISAGLDYPGVGPEHAYWKETGAVTLRVAHRRRGARGVRAPGAHRGHPVRARDRARDRRARRGRAALGDGRSIVVGLSGRGDKDMVTIAAAEVVVRAARGASTGPPPRSAPRSSRT